MATARPCLWAKPAENARIEVVVVDFECVIHGDHPVIRRKGTA